MRKGYGTVTRHLTFRVTIIHRRRTAGAPGARAPATVLFATPSSARLRYLCTVISPYAHALMWVVPPQLPYAYVIHAKNHTNHSLADEGRKLKAICPVNALF